MLSSAGRRQARAVARAHALPQPQPQPHAHARPRAQARAQSLTRALAKARRDGPRRWRRSGLSLAEHVGLGAPEYQQQARTSQAIPLAGGALLVLLLAGGVSSDGRGARGAETKASAHADVSELVTLPLEQLDTKSSKLIGTGAFGLVYELEDKQGHSRVALKLLEVAEAHNASVESEIKALQTVELAGGHPGVVSFRGITFVPGDGSVPEEEDLFPPVEGPHLGLVMELLGGGELYEALVREGAFSEQIAAHVTAQICEALMFLHEKAHVAHLDVKPENLLLATGDESRIRWSGPIIKLCDFGSAVLVDAASGTAKLSADRAHGTAAYSAPELLVASEAPTREVSVAADMWSLGVVLYILLGGTHPFDPDNELLNDAELVPSICRGHFDFTAPVWRGISREAKDLVFKLLQYDPHARLSARQVLEHPWIKHRVSHVSPDPIPHSDTRLHSFLATQRKLQDHLFTLILDGTLRRNSLSKSRQELEGGTLGPALEALDSDRKGFIVESDIGKVADDGDDRTTTNKDAGATGLTNTGHGASSADNAEPSRSSTTTTRTASTPPPKGTSTSPQPPQAADAPPSPPPRVEYRRLRGIAGVGQQLEFKAGDVVFSVGESADHLYYIDKGRVEVVVRDTRLAVLGPGDIVGEQGCLERRPRNATVRALEDASLVKLSRSEFEEFVLRSRTKRAQVEDLVRERTAEHVFRVYEELRGCETVRLEPGDTLFNRGDESESLFFILQGELEVLNSHGHVVAVRSRGDTVGELGLLSGDPRNSSVRCQASGSGCVVKKVLEKDLDRLLSDPVTAAELRAAQKSRAIEGSLHAWRTRAASSTRVVRVR